MAEDTRVLSRKYSDNYINTVDGYGNALTKSEKGVEVLLHWKEDEVAPRCAEVFGESEDHYAEVGLRFDGVELVDYDGVFEMPSELAELLKANGLDVSYIED
jgi:hypothetical protein